MVVSRRPNVIPRGHYHRRGTMDGTVSFHSERENSVKPRLPTFFFGPCAALLTRFRLLMTSVLRLIGRGLPCSLRNRPHALQSTEPSSSLRQSGVVDVVQF